MRITTTTSANGQITIPKAIRDKLGLQKGTRVDLYVTDKGFIGRLHRESPPRPVAP
jgi:AbrB family looped-hinge helix DNA binding protein